MSRFLNKVLRWMALLAALALVQAGSAAQRIIRAENMTVNRGETNRVYITLESLGDESALGFTLCYDTNHLTFIRAFRGSAATNNFDLELYPLPTLSTNIIHAASKGLIGITVGLDVNSGQVWPAGSNSIVQVLFRGQPGAGTVITPVSFCTNFPVSREISDGDANPLPTTYADALVSVQGACSYSLNTNAATFPPGAGSAAVTLATDAGCAWGAINTNSWITITSPTNGTGNATINYTVAVNTIPAPRSGTFIIAGQTFTVTQQGLTCAYTLSTNAATFAASGGLGSVDLGTAPACAWTIDNTNSWIAITSPTNGTGNAIVNYTVAANPIPAPRSGTFIIAGQTFTVTQQGLTCAYALSTNAATFAASGGLGSAGLSTAPACAWTIDNTNLWIAITSPTSGSGDATVNYSVAVNPTLAPRSGIFIIAGKEFTVFQQGIVCAYSLNTNAASFTAAGGSNSVSLITAAACAWSTENTNSWITIRSTASGTGSATIDYSVAVNPTNAARSGAIVVAGQSFTITQSGTVCTYGLSTNAAAYSASGGAGSVAISTSSSCTWTVQDTNSWIAITSATNGVGNGSVSYTVSVNSSSMTRSGTFTIAGQSFTVTQLGITCAYLLLTNASSFDSVGGIGSVAIVAISDCPWTVFNTNSWITITSPSNGNGTAAVSFNVGANPSISVRTGRITIGGLDYTITQQGVPCNYQVSPISRTHIAAGASNTLSVTVSNPCPWFVVNTNPWITIVSGSSGTGSGTVLYTIDKNLSPSDRTGILEIGGQTISLTQQGACIYTLTLASYTYGYAASTNVFTVNTGPACSWTAVNTNPWITLATTNGMGSNTVIYSVDQNPGIERVGVITVEGQSLVITQHSIPCSLALAPALRTVGSNATSGVLSVLLNSGSSCPWTVITTNNWITITSDLNGTNNGSVAYSVLANTNAQTRTGAVFVDGQAFILTQLAVGNEFAFESISMNPSNQVALKLVGSPLGVWELQSSLDLVTWSKLANVTNTTGHVELFIPSNGATNTFYRLKLP